LLSKIIKDELKRLVHCCLMLVVVARMKYVTQWTIGILQAFWTVGSNVVLELWDVAQEQDIACFSMHWCSWPGYMLY